MRYVDCAAYAQKLKDKIKGKSNIGKLLILTAGDDAPSAAFARGKLKDCAECGIEAIHKTATSNIEMLRYIAEGNANPDVKGIVIQLPLPKEYSEEVLINTIGRYRDIDGLQKKSFFVPSTVDAVMYLLTHELDTLTGKNVLLIGRGRVVGKPLADMLLKTNCTLTIAHSKTANLQDHLAVADVVIAATGHPDLVNIADCTRAELIIDVGTTMVDGKLCGDCYGTTDRDVKVTPVPGGVGLLTRAMLLNHLAGRSR